MHIGHKADMCWGNLSFMLDHDLMMVNCGSFVNTFFSVEKKFPKCCGQQSSQYLKKEKL